MCKVCTNPSLRTTPEQFAFCRLNRHIVRHNRSLTLNQRCESRELYAYDTGVSNIIQHMSQPRCNLYGTHFGLLDKQKKPTLAVRLEVLKLCIESTFDELIKGGMVLGKAVNEVEKIWLRHLWDIGKSEEQEVAQYDCDHEDGWDFIQALAQGQESEGSSSPT